MPNPTQADLHVNQPLTNVSIAYLQQSSAYIADRLFPRVPVQKQSDIFWKMSKSDWRRTDAQKRAPGTESPGTGFLYDTDQYYAHVYAVHRDIDDQVRANADSNFKLDKESTEFITNQMLLQRDLDWNAKYFKPGVWETEYDGASDFTPWDDAASDPIGDVDKWILAFRQLTGYAPNKMVLGANVMSALKNHPDIIDRIKYTQRGIVTEDLIATLFSVPNLYTSYATHTTVAKFNSAREQDALADYEFITPTDAMLLLHVADAPGLMTPTAGYIFTWNGYMAGNSQGIRIKRFRQEAIASDRIEAEMTYDMKVVCRDLGIYVGNAVVNTGALRLGRKDKPDTPYEIAEKDPTTVRVDDDTVGTQYIVSGGKAARQADSVTDDEDARYPQGNKDEQDLKDEKEEAQKAKEEQEDRDAHNKSIRSTLRGAKDSKS